MTAAIQETYGSICSASLVHISFYQTIQSCSRKQNTTGTTTKNSSTNIMSHTNQTEHMKDIMKDS